MMKSKKQIKSKMLVDAQNQLKDRDEVAKIIQEELISQLEGGSFWSELQEIIAQGKPSFQVMAKWGNDSKKKKRTVEIPKDEFVEEHEKLVKALDKPAPMKEESKEAPKEAPKEKKAMKRGGSKIKQRGQLIKKIMAERGVSLAEASKLNKQEGLM